MLRVNFGHLKTIFALLIKCIFTKHHPKVIHQKGRIGIALVTMILNFLNLGLSYSSLGLNRHPQRELELGTQLGYHPMVSTRSPQHRKAII